MNDREAFWLDHYRTVAATGNAWLDLSNAAVQAQSYALVIEAAGPIVERRCLDIGCGCGGLSQALFGFGAAEVTGVDLLPETIQRNAARNPNIRWLCGSLTEAALVAQLTRYDLIFLVEVLQYLPLEATLAVLWDRLEPGGRLVGIVPNAACPLVQRAEQRFEGNYAAPRAEALIRALQSLADLETWTVRGAAFQPDQRLVPYHVADFDAQSPPPNRLLFAAKKAASAVP